MTPTEKYLAEVGQRAEKASPWPWIMDHSGQFDIPRTAENRRFINASRTDVPRLVEMVKLLSKRLQEFAEKYNDCESIWVDELMERLDRIAGGEK